MKKINETVHGATNSGNATLTVLPCEGKADLPNLAYHVDAQKTMDVLNRMPSGTVDRVLEMLLDQRVKYYRTGTMDDVQRRNYDRFVAALESMKEINQTC